MIRRDLNFVFENRNNVRIVQTHDYRQFSEEIFVVLDHLIPD